jgi:hypothetical protein
MNPGGGYRRFSGSGLVGAELFETGAVTGCGGGLTMTAGRAAAEAGGATGTGASTVTVGRGGGV